MIEEKFKTYVENIIELTLGFKPEVVVTQLDNKSVQIMLDGTPEQRAEMMGRDANNFQAFKGITRLYGRREGKLSYLYIKVQKQDAEDIA